MLLVMIALSCGVLWYCRANLIIWTIAMATLLTLLSRFSHADTVFALITAWTLFLAIGLLVNLRGLRRSLISKPLLSRYRRWMSWLATVKQRDLTTASLGVEVDLFRGLPEWSKLRRSAAPKLNPEEQTFLAGPVAELCRLINADVSTAIWQVIKQEGFLGITIPKAYGGKGFSIFLYSEMWQKLPVCKHTLSFITAILNASSLTKLIVDFGTEHQKNYYLPRLAQGLEIPCYVARVAAIQGIGIIGTGEFQGKVMTGVHLHWEKSRIALASVATILGLPFKLHDPEHLLGKPGNYGIGYALIPSDLPGVARDCQHGIIQGQGVFIPLDWVIGDITLADNVWQVPPEGLAADYPITMSSIAVGAMKLALQSSSAYARIRQRLGLLNHCFEDPAEGLVCIAAYTYAAEAVRLLMCTAVAQGEQSLMAALSHHHLATLSSMVSNDVKDIQGYLACCYAYLPLDMCSTVARNGTTHKTKIFSETAAYFHPYLLAEFAAANNPIAAQGLRDFDRAFFAHVGYTLSNIVRSLLLGLSSGWLMIPPRSSMHRYYQHLSRFSAAYALLADVALVTLGVHTEQHEKLLARLGAMLSLLHCVTAVLKCHHDQEEPEADLVLVKWVCHAIFFRLQQQFHEILCNLSPRWLAWLLRPLIFPWGRHFNKPADRLEPAIAALFLEPSATRARLIQACDINEDSHNLYGELEAVLRQINVTESIEKRVLQADQEGRLAMHVCYRDKIEAALAAGVITADEAQALLVTEQLCQGVMAADKFTAKELAIGDDIK